MGNISGIIGTFPENVRWVSIVHARCEAYIQCMLTTSNGSSECSYSTADSDSTITAICDAAGLSLLEALYRTPH